MIPVSSLLTHLHQSIIGGLTYTDTVDFRSGTGLSEREYTDEFDEKEREDEHEDSPKEQAHDSDEGDASQSPLYEDLGISESEMRAYSVVLSVGNITKGDLVLLLRDQGFDDVDSLVQRLVEKEMVVELPGIVTRYQAVPPFDGLAEEVSHISQRMESLREELREQILAASKQVRDALLAVSSEKLESISAEKEQIHRSKGDAIDRLEKSLSDLESERGSLEDHLGAQMRETTSAWTQETVSAARSALDESKGSLSSLGSELENELSGISVDIEDQLKALNSELGSSLSDVTSQAISRIEAKKEELNQELISNSESVSAGLSTTERSLVSSVEDTHQRTATSLEEISDRINTGIEKVEGDVGVSIDSAVNMASDQYDTLETEMIQALSDHAAREYEILDEHSKALDDEISEFGSSKDEAVSMLKNRLENAVSEYESSAGTAVSSMSEQIQDMSARAKSSVTTASDSMHRLASHALQDSYERVDEYATTTLAHVSKELEQKRQEFGESLQSTGNEINAINRESLDLTTGLLETYRSEITQQLRQVMESTSTQLEQVSHETIAELDSLSSSVRDEIAKAISRAKSQTEAMQTRATQQITEAITTSIEGLDSDVSQRIEGSRKKHDSMVNRIDATVTHEISSGSEILQELQNKIDADMDGFVASADENRRNQLGALESGLGEERRAAEESLGRAAAETQDLVDLLHTGLQDSVQKMHDGIKAASSSLDSSTERLKVGHTTAKEELLKSTKDDLESQVNSLSNQIRSMASSGRSQVRENAAAGMNTFSESLEALQQESSSKIGGALEEMRSVIGGALEETHNAFTNSRTEIATVIDRAGGDIVATLNDVSSDLSEHKHTGHSRLDKGVSAATTGAQSRLESAKVMVNSTVKSSVQNLGSTEERLGGSISSAANKLSSESIAALSEFLEKSSAAIERVSVSAKNDIRSGYDDIMAHAGSLENILADAVNDLEKRPAIGISEESVDEAVGLATETPLDTQRVADVLSKVWERLGTTDFPGAKKTWTIVTRDAVLAHMKDMLARAKSKVTLIIPEAHDIPTDTLKELKSTIGVELVVTESPVLNREAGPLVGRGNIRVRSRSEKDVYACVRDSEEVLLAPAASADSDVIGFVSEDDGFVRFVMSIIGPIFQARTTMLKPEDL